MPVLLVFQILFSSYNVSISFLTQAAKRIYILPISHQISNIIFMEISGTLFSLEVLLIRRWGSWIPFLTCTMFFKMPLSQQTFTPHPLTFLPLERVSKPYPSFYQAPAWWSWILIYKGGKSDDLINKLFTILNLMALGLKACIKISC